MTPRGKLKWQTVAGNFVTSSPAHRRRRHACTWARSTARSTRSTPRTGEARWRFQTDDHVYASPALGPAARVHRLHGRLGLCAWTAPGGCAGATTPATRCAPRRCSGARRAAAAGSSTWARSNGSLYALDAETGAPALVVRHDAARPGAARPQRPELLAGARPPRRVHRRRARPDRARALRLVPARAATARCDRGPGEAFARRPHPHGLRHAGRLHAAVRAARARWPRPPRSAPAWWCAAAARRSTRRAARLPTRVGQPAVRLPPRSSRATATSSTWCPSGFLRPGTRYSVRVARRLGRETAPRAGWTTRSASAPRRCCAAARRCGRAAPGLRLRAQPPGRAAARRSSRASTRSASTATTWWWARSTCRSPTRGGEGSLLLWAVSTRRGPGGRAGGRPARRVRVPARGPLPPRLGDRLAERAEPHLQLRRRAAAPLRPADAARPPACAPAAARPSTPRCTAPRCPSTGRRSWPSASATTT